MADSVQWNSVHLCKIYTHLLAPGDDDCLYMLYIFSLLADEQNEDEEMARLTQALNNKKLFHPEINKTANSASHTKEET